MTKSVEFRFSWNRRGRRPDYNRVLSGKRMKVADCTAVFMTGPFKGHMLEGFTIWRNLETSKVSVNPPNRVITSGPLMGSYYNVFRQSDAPVDELRPSVSKALAKEMCRQFRLWAGENPEPAQS